MESYRKPGIIFYRRERKEFPSNTLSLGEGQGEREWMKLVSNSV